MAFWPSKMAKISHRISVQIFVSLSGVRPSISRKYQYNGWRCFCACEMWIFFESHHQFYLCLKIKFSIIHIQFDFTAYISISSRTMNLSISCKCQICSFIVCHYMFSVNQFPLVSILQEQTKKNPFLSQHRENTINRVHRRQMDGN